jgi:hypothetical protein
VAPGLRLTAEGYAENSRGTTCRAFATDERALAASNDSLMLVAFVALSGCGGGSHASHADGGSDASGHDGGAVTDGGGGTDATEDVGLGMQDAGVVDAQEEAEPVEAGPCAPLGGSCTTSASCFCGLAAGCEDDNVTCDAGRCVVASLPVLDGGLDPIDECCATCQYAYDTGGTVSDWLSCNQACGAGACPVTCLAEVMGSP